MTFDELDPKTTHIYQAFLGVSHGIRVSLFHPFDIKTLKWDERIEDIDENATAHITSDDSDYEDPDFSIWISHARYPGLRVRNVSPRSLVPKVQWTAAKFNYEHVVDADLLDKLSRKKIPSEPVTFGGEM